MSTPEPSTKMVGQDQRNWLQKMSTALGLTAKSEVALSESDAIEGDNDLLLDFVCRIVIVNKTDVALRKGPDNLEIGRYQIRPAAIVPARQSVAFTILGKIIVAGNITWIPDGGLGETWELEYALAPPGLVTQKFDATRTLTSDRFTDELDDTKAKEAELRFIIKQRDSPPPRESFVSRVTVTNATDRVLRKKSDFHAAGVFETAPPPTIAPRRTIDFEVRSQERTSRPKNKHVVDGRVTWTPDGQPDWSTSYSAATGRTSRADADIRSERLISDTPDVDGTNFRFILRDKSDPPPPRPESFVCRVIVSNLTKGPLTKVRDSLSVGTYEAEPRQTIPAGEMMEFTVRSGQETVAGLPREVAAGSAVWLPDGADSDEEWLIQYSESPEGTDQISMSLTLSQRFVAIRPEFGTVYLFRLSEKPLPPPRTNEFVCRVVVVNNTDVPLQQKDLVVNPGITTKKPPTTIAPRTSAELLVRSELDSLDGTEVVKGFMAWEPAGFPRGELWKMSFLHRHTDQDGTAQQELDSIRFTAEPPSISGADFQFTLQPVAEPKFEKPEPTRQPTLRKNDKSADGWVEYLQAQLNALLKPSPNLKVDGDFGQATHKAVFAFQAQEDIQRDGVVGNQTWAELRNGPSEEPSTDKRKPHSFEEKGLEARWLTEDPVATYSPSKDELVLVCVSLGDQTSLEGHKVNLFVTPPGGDRRGFVAKIGERITTTATGQGDRFKITVADFRKAFPSNPEGAPIEDYVVEGFFDEDLGSDFYTSTRGGFTVVD